MAYSTRRKSVNYISLLGIHSSRLAQRSPPMHDDSILPPSKKLKRSHSDGSSVDKPAATSTFERSPEKQSQTSSEALQTSPASSPPCGGELDGLVAPPPKVNTEAIDDDVVVATIEELEKTDNRPHLLKELAIAISHIPVVTTSANQSAIISSRLTNFLKRPWTTAAPCPLGKELVGTHPKRLFFFLTTQPRQEIPDPETINAANKAARMLNTPSLTSATSEDEDTVGRHRTSPSLSPELELDIPDFDFDMQSYRTGPFTHIPASPAFSLSRTLPALERDEHEFTKTATKLLQIEADSRHAQTIESTSDFALFESPSYSPALDNSWYKHTDSVKEFIFGQSDSLSCCKPGLIMSSPIMCPHTNPDVSSFKAGLTAYPLGNKSEFNALWAELQSPEALALDELEDLFKSY